MLFLKDEDQNILYISFLFQVLILIHEFSLHKYTDADQINNENSSDEVFEGEERAVVDNNDEDPSLEISSFSNQEQKYKMDKAERKAIKEYKKQEKVIASF